MIEYTCPMCGGEKNEYEWLAVNEGHGYEQISNIQDATLIICPTCYEWGERGELNT